MTFRLGAAFAAAVFAVTSGITAMEVHQLAAHGGEPLAAPTTPPTPTASAPRAHAQHGQVARQGEHGHDAHHGHAAAARASHHLADDPAAQDHQASRSGHSGHHEHGPTECTCVGPCASGAPPTLSEPFFAEMWLGEPDPVRLVAAPVDPVHQDPRSYLLPFPNPPPDRA